MPRRLTLSKGQRIEKPNIIKFPTPQALADYAVRIFINDAETAIKANGKFFTAVSGGQTPKLFFKKLGENSESLNLPWDKIHLFWVDERCVPPDSDLSNYRLAAATFLPKILIPAENIHRIPAEKPDIQQAAKDYADEIRQVFSLKNDDFPRFDLIFLGLGADGHIASLFPGREALSNMRDLVCAVKPADGTPNRITLTPPVLCGAKRLVIMAAGDEKSRILKQITQTPPNPAVYPVHLLWPVLDKVLWLIDDKAARYI